MASEVRLVSFNGELIPETEAKVSIYDSALMFGDMVFSSHVRYEKKNTQHDRKNMHMKD